MKPPWKILRANCSSIVLAGTDALFWNMKVRSSIHQEMAGQVKNFPALEWLAAMCSHIPNGASRWSDTTGITVMYSTGENEKKTGKDDAIPCILETGGNMLKA